jgi:hypothetical protein
VDENFYEIIPGEFSLETVLEEIARLSYETAGSALPEFIQPLEVPSFLVDFRGLITSEGLQMDFLNGRLCSTHVERRGDRLLFNAERFRDDRGSPELFLNLLKRSFKNIEKHGEVKGWS